MTPYEPLWNLLREFFNYEHYEAAIQRAHAKIAADPRYQQHWQTIRTAITERAFDPDQPLELVEKGANQVLDDNSDEEAYLWLDRMVQNIEREDGRVDLY